MSVSKVEVEKGKEPLEIIWSMDAKRPRRIDKFPQTMVPCSP